MRTLLALLVLSITPQVVLAAPIIGTLDLVETNVETFDPSTFTAGPTIDVYHVVLNNPNASGVTGFELSFPGLFENRSAGSPLQYKRGADLPTLGPNIVAESFFVVPDVWPLDIIFVTEFLPPFDGLRGSMVGSSDLPAGWHTIAVLSVLAGSSAPDITNFVGQAWVNGGLQDIVFVPEPSTVLLTLLGVAGFAVRRRC